MILDKGICSIYKKVNTAGPGEMPVYQNQLIHQSWYGELSFETNPSRPTESREMIQTDARIRILQCRSIAKHDRVVLSPAWPTSGETLLFEVQRAFHGYDPESGELITDLSLRRVAP